MPHSIPLSSTLLIFIVIAQPALGEGDTVTQMGKYQLKMGPSGSGGFFGFFGLPEQVRSYDNAWTVWITKDEMTDKPVIVTYRSSYRELSPSRTTSGKYSLKIYLSNPANERVCVFGHDHPSKKAMIRVDKNKAIETNAGGCMTLSKELDTQLRNGQTAKVKGYTFSSSYSGSTNDVDLDGYGILIDYLRSTR